MSQPSGQAELLKQALQTVTQRRGVSSVRGASLKQVLRNLNPDFDEKKLGYSSFADFLKSHPGVVSLTHDGVDIVVEPVDKALSSEAKEGELGPTRTSRLKVIRQDLWRAFTFVATDIDRFFDQEEGKAVLLPRQVASGEPEITRSLRSSLSTTPGRFIQITPISADDQLAQIKAFIGQVPSQHPLKVALETSATHPQWFRAFTTTLRADRALEWAWSCQRADAALARIKSWMRAHSLEITRLVEERADRPTSAPASPGPSVDGQPVMEARLRRDFESRARRRAIRAVERMPLAQLLTLTIPLEYTFDD